MKVKLIGSFPHTVTTGHPVKAGESMPDFTVRAMIITADARSGHACLPTARRLARFGEDAQTRNRGHMRHTVSGEQRRRHATEPQHRAEAGNAEHDG